MAYVIAKACLKLLRVAAGEIPVERYKVQPDVNLCAVYQHSMKR